jgi:hypothetical protein
MAYKEVDKYNDKLAEKGICRRDNIARIIKDFRAQYPELSHYKRIPGTVQFNKATNLIEEFFLATAPLWLQCYKELNLSSRYEMVGGSRTILITSDDMMGLVYLELPKVMMIINYDPTKSPKQYFKNRMRMLAHVYYGAPSEYSETDYAVIQEDIAHYNHHDEEYDAGI